jgi:hypothetical protein
VFYKQLLYIENCWCSASVADSAVHCNAPCRISTVVIAIASVITLLPLLLLILLLLKLLLLLHDCMIVVAHNKQHNNDGRTDAISRDGACSFCCVE